MPKTSSASPERIARAARMYPSDTAAARALHLSLSTFRDQCKALDIERPFERNTRLKRPTSK